MKLNEFFEKRGAESLLAKEMAVSRQTVSLWCLGKNLPNVTNVIKMSKALCNLGVETTPAELLKFFNKARESYQEADIVF